MIGHIRPGRLHLRGRWVEIIRLRGGHLMTVKLAPNANQHAHPGNAGFARPISSAWQTGRKLANATVAQLWLSENQGTVYFTRGWRV